jgi:hypothetical protein
MRVYRHLYPANFRHECAVLDVGYGMDVILSWTFGITSVPWQLRTESSISFVLWVFRTRGNPSNSSFGPSDWVRGTFLEAGA